MHYTLYTQSTKYVLHVIDSFIGTSTRTVGRIIQQSAAVEMNEVKRRNESSAGRPSRNAHMSAISPLLKLLLHVRNATIDSTLEFTGINETIFSCMFEKQHELLTKRSSETEKNPWTKRGKSQEWRWEFKKWRKESS
jgi:hypothetical protein